jgi:hypothetical protein
VHKADVAAAHEAERRQESERGAAAPGVVHGHQHVSDFPRPSADDRDGARCVSGGGERRAADQETLEWSEPAGSKRDHVSSRLLRLVDDLDARIALYDHRLHPGPPRPEDIRRSLPGSARLLQNAFAQFSH